MVRENTTRAGRESFFVEGTAKKEYKTLGLSWTIRRRRLRGTSRGATGCGGCGREEGKQFSEQRRDQGK